MITMEEFSNRYLDKSLGEYDGIYDAICYRDDKIEVWSSGSFIKDLRYFKVLIKPIDKNFKVVRINMRKPEYLKSGYKLSDELLQRVIKCLDKDSIGRIITTKSNTVWESLNYFNNDIRFNEVPKLENPNEPEVLPIPDYTKLNK